MAIADLVKCNNCSTENMKIKLGGEVCPICGAMGALSWMNEELHEVECSKAEILEVIAHDWQPTDSEGHNYECSDCGDDYNVWSGVDGKHYISEPNEDLIELYAIGNKVPMIYKDYGQGLPIMEICCKALIDNFRKLYGSENIEGYEVSERIQKASNSQEEDVIIYTVNLKIKVPCKYTVIYENLSECFIKNSLPKLMN